MEWLSELVDCKSYDLSFSHENQDDMACAHMSQSNKAFCLAYKLQVFLKVGLILTFFLVRRGVDKCLKSLKALPSISWLSSIDNRSAIHARRSYDIKGS